MVHLQAIFLLLDGRLNFVAKSASLTLGLCFLIGAQRQTRINHRTLQSASRVQMLRGWQLHCG